MPSCEDPAERRRRKLHAEAMRYKLSKQERCDLASMILRRDVTSWTQLDDEQVTRLLDAFDGLHILLELLHQRA